MACGHFFCNGCYTSYVSLEVAEARVKLLSCPSLNCAQPIGEVSAWLLLGTQKATARLLRFVAAAQVADDKRSQQCTRARCGAVLRVRESDALRQYSPGFVELLFPFFSQKKKKILILFSNNKKSAFGCCSRCMLTRCLRCNGPGHWPASCEVVQWAAMVFAQRQRGREADDEMRSMQWIIGNTKVTQFIN